MFCNSDSVDFLYLPGVCGNSASVVHDQQDWRSGVDYVTLSFRPGPLPRSLHSELGLPILHRGLF